MRKRRAQMGVQITAVSGQIRYLKDIISKNLSAAQQNMKLAEQAKKMATTSDMNEALHMKLQMQAKANKAGRLQQSNIGYQQILGRLQSVYDMLTKFANHADFFIEDTQDAVDQAKIQYKTTRTAWGAFRTAMSIISGNSSEDEMFNQAMEQMAEDSSQKLGEMEDLQRLSQNFMDSIDLQNAAVGDDALKQLDQYEQKLLTDGSNGSMSFLLPGTQQQAAGAIPINRSASVPTGTDGSDYNDIFK
jgi:hypothetical protein